MPDPEVKKETKENQDAVEALTLCLPIDEFSGETARILVRICHCLNVGASIRGLTQRVNPVDNRATFEVEQDYSGGRSNLGPRHDNDHEYIEDIQILPTREEIRSNRTEYLPLHEPARNHLPGVKGLLDRQFRLLREETIGSLRGGVRQELESLQESSARSRSITDIEQRERTTNYQNVRFLRIEMDRRRGLQITAVFDQNYTEAERKEWWEHSKRLMTHTLVCIVQGSGRAIFCLIGDPSPVKPNIKHKEGDEDDERAAQEVQDYERRKAQAPRL